MSHFAEPRQILAGSFRSGRLWLIQFFLNPILFALFGAWLLIPEAKLWQLALNVLLVALIAAAALLLHAGTLNYFSDQFREQSAAVTTAFRRALRHFAAIAVCAIVFSVVWALAGGLDAYRETISTYFRSMLPASVRGHIPLVALIANFGFLDFLLQWVVVPGLLLPLTLLAADQGFRGFRRAEWTGWKATIASLHYWVILTVAAILGVYGTETIMGWRPASASPTFVGETANLAFRLFLAYGLGLFSWMLACSLISRRCGIAQSVSGNSAA
jgi:uncharacterized membrane protein